MTLDEIIKAIGIEPFHHEEAGVIYNADCLSILPKIPAGAIDLVLTDPPYGLNGCSGDKTSFTNNGSTVVKFGESWDMEYPIDMIALAHAITNAEGSFISFCSMQGYNAIENALRATGYLVKNHIGWDKRRIGVNPRRNYCSAFEIAIWGVKSKSYVWNGGATTSNLYREDYCELNHPPNNVHPTQKPQSIMRWLTSNHSNPAGIILDPFLGSGTTAVAAKQLGRKFIGIEIEPRYAKIAVDRLRQGVLEL
jgi:site-specific DNA-methyltransferase (adenine-specific)